MAVDVDKRLRVRHGDGETRSLGPVCYRLRPGGDKKLMEKMEADLAVERDQVLAAAPREGIYCGVVPTAWKGKFRLEVVTQDGKLLAERLVTVDKPASHCWWTFARVAHRRREGEPMCVVVRRSVPAWPAFQEFRAIWPPEDREVKFVGDPPLPGRIPMGFDWLRYYAGRIGRAVREGEVPCGLALSLEKGVFVVKCEAKMRRDPDHRLLARWWVNGKSVTWTKPRDALLDDIMRARAVSYGKEMTVGFGLPARLGDLKVGDKVALQVLYTPGKHQWFHNPNEMVFGRALQKLAVMTAGSHEAVHVPMLSNRIEFEVTEAMLDQRKKAADAER